MINAVLVPSWVHGCLEASGCDSHSIQLAIDTDVSLEGQSAREWLLVTPDRISVLVGASEPKVLRAIKLDDVESLRTVAGVGSGMLQAKVGGRWIDMLRFSNAYATDFIRLRERWSRREREGKAAHMPGSMLVIIYHHHLWNMLSRWTLLVAPSANSV